MDSSMHCGPRRAVSGRQLGSLLDKLIAVQMDLEPVCGLKEARAPVIPERDVIAGACEVLNSVIADLVKIVRQIDRLIEPADAAGAAITDRPKQNPLFMQARP